jgi:hypothetical protein
MDPQQQAERQASIPDPQVQASLTAAVLGAHNIQAPQSNPMGAYNGAEISNYNKGAFQLPQSQGASKAAGFNDSTLVSNQIVNRKNDKILAQRQMDVADKSKYRRIRKADGGFDFVDPNGKQIDIATLSKLTDTKPEYWISDSENPTDIQYIEQKKHLDTYLQAKLGGDQKTVNAYEATDPALQSYQGKGGPHQLIQDFYDHFKRYYSPQDWGANNGDNMFHTPDPYGLSGGGGIGA